MLPFKEVDRPFDYNLSKIALKSGFKFRDIENRRLDWKTLGCVDVNKVIENQDFEFLEKITPKIIEAPMQSILNSAALDPAVSSLFRLAQMSLQYLSFCQQFMSHTVYDLRTAFNLLQKKYTILKQNYKCIEEQHYKAQERIQMLLNENRIDQAKIQTPKPVSLYPCDQCTKNFLTADSLKSHQQRKHSAIGEKHELSDDNEKGDFDTGEAVNKVGENSNQLLVSTAQENAPISEIGGFQSNNNNDNGLSTNCDACSQRKKINLSNVAIQCDVAIVDSLEVSTMQTKINVTNDDSEEQDKQVPEKVRAMENDLIEKAHQTIVELKREIEDLKNTLDIKVIAEKPAEFLDLTQDTNMVHTNDKIDIIERKFNAFETMYMESQNKFIESFRNLDERHKVYMDNIQETIKEIVEKSLGNQDETETEQIKILKPVTNDSDNEYENEVLILSNATNIAQSKTENEQSSQLKSCSPIASTDSSSQSEGENEETKIVCQVDVHTVSSAEINLYKQQNEEQNSGKNTKNRNNKIFKNMALNEFEQRLQQFGVDAVSTGLTTPRSCEVSHELAEEREEMKRAHKSFEVTRKKLRNEVNRIAKERLASASSVTSLSSISYQSDNQMFDEIDKKPLEAAVTRPKSASVQKMRNRNAKKIIQKLVKKDIDENDIMDKMQMAQKAINVHRECIQELLQTTAHSPSTVTKIKYPTASKRGESKQQSNDININQYDKMPNITTRRVVFVNLDEDS